jgi:two-component system response regulator AtoC
VLRRISIERNVGEMNSGKSLALLAPGTVAAEAGTSHMLALLPFRDANAPLLSAALEGIDLSRAIAPIFAPDYFRRHEMLIDFVVRYGFHGIANWPSVGCLRGDIDEDLAAAGFGYDRDLALLRKAAARGVRCFACVFSLEDVAAIREIGVSDLIVHDGWDPFGGDQRAAAGLTVHRCS